MNVARNSRSWRVFNKIADFNIAACDRLFMKLRDPEIEIRICVL